MSVFTYPHRGAPIRGARRRVSASALRFASFCLVGGISFVVDVGVFNLLRWTILENSPVAAKVASVAVATAVAWLGNRSVTFRNSRARPVTREAALFAATNVIGLLIAAGCLFVSHYVLGFRSQLADNVAGNGVGLILGMVFRYLAYRFIVFPPPVTQESVALTPSAVEFSAAEFSEFSAVDFSAAESVPSESARF